MRGDCRSRASIGGRLSEAACAGRRIFCASVSGQQTLATCVQGLIDEDEEPEQLRRSRDGLPHELPFMRRGGELCCAVMTLMFWRALVRCNSYCALR